MPEPSLDRREFTLRSLMAMLSGVAITISGCGGGGSGGPTQPSGNDRAGNVSANHGHTAVITSAQLSAGGDLMLNIRGEAPHNHTVQLGAADVAAIRDGRQVSKNSSTDDSHNHTVTFN